MRFDLQPSLTGALIRLRPLKEDDRDPLFSVASDPLIWEQHPETNRYQRNVFDSFFDEALKANSALIALDAKTGEALGSSRYYEWDPGKSVAIGYTFLSRACWGQGHNREMKDLMIDHAFQFVDTVIFHVGEDNARSRKAMEKIGAVFIGPVERRLPDGSSNPSVQFEIKRPKNA